MHYGDRIRRGAICIRLEKDPACFPPLPPYFRIARRTPGRMVRTITHGLARDVNSETSQAATLIFHFRFPRTLGPLTRPHLAVRPRLKLFTLGAIGNMHTPSPRYIDVDQRTGAHDASMRGGAS